MRLFVDVSDASERIDNALRFLGDTWLAQLHSAAIREFGVPRWQQQLRDKLELLRQINQFLVDDVANGKALRLELAIVVLIMVEILFALFKII